MHDVAIPLTRSAGLGSSLLTGLMAFGDIMLLQAWLNQDLLMVVVMALHLCLVLAFGVLSYLFCTRSRSKTFASAAILALFGPFGGPALMIIAPSLASSAMRAVSRPKRSSPASRPREAAEDLFDQIRQCRRHPLPEDIVPGFLHTFQVGTLRQQQEAIAAISRGYHPEMRPALLAALALPVPALRVQAAAVYAKLRGSYGNRAKDLLDRGGTVGNRAAVLEVVASGFVDEGTCNRLLDLAAWDTPDPPPARPPCSAFNAMPRLKRHACGGLT